MPKGMILKGVGGVYTVSSNDSLYNCKPRGVFRNVGLTPLPGDYVRFEILDDEEGTILEILPRNNELTRPAVANVDIAAIVVALSAPVPDYFMIDKIAVICLKKGIEPVLIANKSDKADSGIKAEIKSIYGPTGFKSFYISAKTGEGIDDMVSYFGKKTVVFAGQSGTGKSTILNTIMGKEVMETGSISKRIERGRHTTRHTNFILTSSGTMIADTPGFSNVEPGILDEKDLHRHYPEFTKPQGYCRFQGCIHVHEPDCVVKKGVEQGLISQNRYDNYMRMYNELAEINKQRRGY